MSGDTRSLAVDVHYEGALARAAGISFSDFGDEQAASSKILERAVPADYQPGRFFERELPCILPLVGAFLSEGPIATIVIDGYVDLGPSRPGLGRKLYEALEGRIEIVGVAKTRFRSAEAHELLRGSSRAPLFITATGDRNAAARAIASMAGRHRIPTLLGRVDRLARGDR